MTAFSSVTGTLLAKPVIRRPAPCPTFATASLLAASDEEWTNAKPLRFSLIAFDGDAETLANQHKGQIIRARGMLELDFWTDKTGQEHERLQIIVEEVEALTPAAPWGAN